MKKLIFLLSVSLLVGCGTAETKEEPQTMSASTEETKTDETKAEEPKEEVVEMPTKRTANTMGQSYPWQWAGPSVIKESVDRGEINFLWSDAQKIEEQIEYFVTYTPEETGAVNEKPAEERKKEAQISWNEYVKVFVYEMKEQGLENDEYLTKLSKAGELLAQHKEDEVLNILSELESIRQK